MKIIWQAHTVAKYGNRPEENEDAFSPIWNNKVFSRKERFVCTLADGATRTSFSSLWAKLLVEILAHSRGGLTGPMILAAQKEWSKAINNMNLPWHAEEKVKQGSFSTLLWFRATPSLKKPGGYWKATAVGDSCLFQLRNGELITKYPIDRSEDFANNPVLISSIPAKNQSILETLSSRALDDKRWLPEDEFLLMTDALACWFLHETEIGNSPITDLSCLLEEPEASQSRFEELISRLRSSNAIKNDDTSLIWIRLAGE